MRKLMIGCALGVIVLCLVACTSSGASTETVRALQRQADLYQIDQIEKNFHEATTKKDIDQMMSLWAPNATLTIGPGQTAAGLSQIRGFWLGQSTAFMSSTHWVSDHPAYKVEITVNGDRGTLHFECHYVNYDTKKVEFVTVADQDVARIDGRWLITNMIAATTTLTP
jgi:ketosteroid isomerase-like protein